ncbi:methyltransferase like 25 [Nesidiocoris tenuis]|nr:methyltransferase like 25 [Nesidiocoris tenuis]
MVSFITDDLWHKFVPADLRLEYEETGSPSNVYELFFDSDCLSGNDRLRRFLRKAKSMSTTENGLFYDLDAFDSHLDSLGCKTSDTLKFDKFMCPKKTHEVGAMSRLAADVGRFLKVDTIVDIGDGKGYLSSVLALENRFKVLGIDASPVNSLGAAKRVEKMKKHWKGVRKKMIGADEDKLRVENVVYERCTEFVNDTTDVREIVLRNIGDTSCLGIVGLHTCGSLTSTCLRHFVKTDTFKFIINVACCHHLISQNDFPMSDHLKMASFSLTRNAKMMSLQPISRIIDDGHVKSDPLMYRAVFEHLMDHVLGLANISKPEVGRISAKCSNFVQYARKACSKLDLRLDMTDEEISTYYDTLRVQHESKLKFYFLLRLAVAPVIDNVILLDRLVFLMENGLEETSHVQMFDPVVSPRNYAIISMRL